MPLTAPDEGGDTDSTSGSSSGDLTKPSPSNLTPDPLVPPAEHQQALSAVNCLQGELEAACAQREEEAAEAATLRRQVEGLRAELDRAEARVEVLQR